MRNYREAKADFERQYLRELMTQAQGSVTRAAELAGLNRTGLYDILKRNEVPPRYNNPRLNRGNDAWRSLGS